jgi:hypothetical protein
MTKNYCIHIQTTPNHFKYVYSFLKSVAEKVQNIENVPIFIIFDTVNESSQFVKSYDKKLDIRFLCMEDIVPHSNLLYSESYENCISPSQSLPVKWGAGGHRDYVAVKRSYSILALEELGFDYVWCLDSESKILKEFEINDFMEKNTEQTTLLIGSGIEGVRYPYLFLDLFGWKTNKLNSLYKINVRMNDFWMINTKYFRKMIDDLQKVHKKELSYFMNGSEQTLYEYFLFKHHSDGDIDLNIINIFGNTNANILFWDYYTRPRNELEKLASFMNDYYFDLTNSFRGDYINYMRKHERGSKFYKLLNIKIAVSNYQGY